MARMLSAIWRPLAADYATAEPRLTSVDVVCLHTMVGGLDGTDSYFRVTNGAGFSGTESHFGIGGDGRTVQWQDTAYEADANLDGGLTVLSIENADHGPEFPAWSGSDVPAFTPAQVEANAQVLAWVHRTHGVPLELIPDTKPGRRGVGFHRQGIDPWRVSGGVRWSGSTGKVCPGDRRVAQIPSIIARAKQIVAGGSTPTPVPVPTPVPTPTPSGWVAIPLGGITEARTSGAQVKADQLALLVAGFGVGPSGADGFAGADTVTAIRGFQAAAGLTVDGRMGPATRTAAGRVPGYPGGGAYARFQQRLRDRGWALTVDGVWGAESKRTLAAFQAEKGLTADGTPGPASWVALWVRPL